MICIGQKQIINFLREKWPEKLSGTELVYLTKLSQSTIFANLSRLMKSGEVSFEYSDSLKHGRPFRVYFVKPKLLKRMFKKGSKPEQIIPKEREMFEDILEE